MLLLTSAIWGFAFVAQRAGMEHLGPFLFNGIRFALGGLVLLPVIFFIADVPVTSVRGQFRRALYPDGLVLGVILFVAASFQQTGIVKTTAGKAGFITGLYVIIVPLTGIFLKKTSGLVNWIGAVLAVFGLYFLSISRDALIPSPGDLLVLISAFFWALHVHSIDYYVDRTGAILLAFMQFMICSFLSLTVAIVFEPVHIEPVFQAAVPLIYAGIFSAGIGYTLQVVAQREAHPSHAAIILSLEAVFAALGGWILLSEYLNAREIFGCFLMLGGMMISQLRPRKRKRIHLMEP